MSKFTELLDDLVRKRKNTQVAYKLYTDCKRDEDITRDMLLAEMQAEGLKSGKTKDFTASIAERVNIEIMHEPSVIDWLKHQPNLEADLYIGLKKQAFTPIAKTILKSTGEKIPGTEIQVTEYISIRENGKDKK